MKSCTDIEPLLTALLDDEITADDRERVNQHLERCSPCRRLADEQRTARTVLRVKASSVATPAPRQLHERCAALRTSTPAWVATARRGPRWLPSSVAAGIVAVLATAAAAGVLMSRLEVGLAAQLTVDHLKCFAFAPAEPTTDSPDRIAVRFKEAHGWDVAVPPTAPPDGLELVSARRCLYGEGLMAHVMYDWHGAPLSLFVLPGTDRASRLFHLMGHDAIIWPDQGNTYALVGQASTTDMQWLAAQLRSRMRRRAVTGTATGTDEAQP
jgi:anti-sigma factor (TIGR02949 family)